MQIQHNGDEPKVDPSARIAATAVLCGDVTVGANCSIGFGAVLIAESGPIVLGNNVVVMDTAVLRGVRGNGLRLEDNVLIGPRAVLTGCIVEREAFVATGATVFNGARIGQGAEIRVNGIVHLRSTLPSGAVVPLGWIAVGDPARILPPDKHEEIWAIQKPLDFPRYVFGVNRPPEGENFMADVMPRYASRLAKLHASDRETEQAI
jgi:carbonic anhydrase/acetyltransferase-like protein (isoleucine patch superfamily)